MVNGRTGGEMTASLAMVTVVVNDYESGIRFFRDRLGLALIEDFPLEGGKRWVVLAGPRGGRLLLAEAANDRQRAAIGNQAGGRVGFFLETEISPAITPTSWPKG
jgi:catechol 2,3-dioxygenase-like lactoylglutathione lyase family enzyme